MIEAKDSDLKSFVSRITMRLENEIHEVKEGNKNALPLYGQLKILNKLVGGYIKDLQKQAEDEIKYYDHKEKNIGSGYRLKFVPGGKMYSYKNTDQWKVLRKELSDLEDTLKHLKTPVALEETGEMMYPAMVSYKSDSIKLEAIGKNGTDY